MIDSASTAIGAYVGRGATVILEVDNLPGDTEELVAPLLETASGLQGRHFYLGYSPERIDPGNSVGR